jgi:hypothetical protein
LVDAISFEKIETPQEAGLNTFYVGRVALRQLRFPNSREIELFTDKRWQISYSPLREASKHGGVAGMINNLLKA